MIVRKKKLKRKKRIVLGLLIIIFFSFAIFGLVTERKLFFLEGISRDLLLSTNAFLVSSFSNDDTSKNQDQTLQLENEELQKEINELKEMLSIQNVLSDKVIVTANVIHRNLGFFYETLTINKGNKDGLTDGMAVVAANGLIGKTKNVTEHYSDVLLLFSPKVGKISVKIRSGQDYAYGLLTDYDTDKNVYKIEGISSTIPIEVGEEVTTTGMGDIFPSGILIGTVSSITTDHFDLAQIIEVTPAVNINDFSVVFVLKRNVNNE